MKNFLCRNRGNPVMIFLIPKFITVWESTATQTAKYGDIWHILLYQNMPEDSASKEKISVCCYCSPSLLINLSCVVLWERDSVMNRNRMLKCWRAVKELLQIWLVGISICPERQTFFINWYSVLKLITVPCSFKVNEWIVGMLPQHKMYCVQTCCLVDVVVYRQAYIRYYLEG